MKKIVLVLFFTILASSWLPAQSIIITSPPAGADWLLGSSHVITWTYNGLPDNTQVKVSLFLGNEKKGSLVESTGIGSNGSGSWTWTHAGDYIGGKAAAGNGYKIRVRDLANKCPSTDSGLFNLKKSAANYDFIAVDAVASNFQLWNNINVSMPAKGLQVKPGDGLAIQWDKTSIATYPQVKFAIYLPDRKTYYGPIHKTGDGLKPNTGHYDDAVIATALYEVGKEYVIRVATPDDKFTGFSGIFRVIPLEAFAKTETFTGARSIAFRTIESSNWPGCMYTHGEAPSYPSNGYAVGWENDMQDPTGPCWKYIGHIYRTLVDPYGIYQGFVVTKAVLRISVISGIKQAFYILRRDDAADWGKTTPVATVASWGFGPPVEVDITPLVQAWCTGQLPNHGLIIRGGDESFAHNNANAQCVLANPELVITRTEYK